MEEFNEKKFIETLKGRFDNLPKDRSRVVRIFLSSTFSDTHAERDYLIEFVYPNLKKYCKQKYGLDFQVLDMRWGISDEATNNHQASNICMNEIRNSQNVSIGPNFVGILSHRYGSRGLPTTIIEDEYKLFKDEMKTNPNFSLSFKYESNVCKIDQDDIVDYCYQIDENEIPFHYRLKNISKIIPNYVQKNPEYVQIWEKIERKLSNLFRLTADICQLKEKITADKRNKYFVSVTEKEFYNGILNIENAKNNSIVFLREIEDIEKNIEENTRLAGCFIELDENNEIDKDVGKHLKDLRTKVKKALPKENIHELKVKWDPQNGISKVTHKDYLEKFGLLFYNSVKELIDRNASKPNFLDNFKLKDRVLMQEVLDHATFCVELIEKFHGRNDLIQNLKNYVIEKNNHPYIIFGESGCGKTAIIAKFASEILKIVPDPGNYVIILRFLGTTPGTSNITSTLKSVINQLIRIFNMKPPDSRLDSKNDVKDFLDGQLFDLSIRYPEKKILILLDSIDQLSTSDYNIDWMLLHLPNNIKFIYSTLPNHGDILNQLNKESMFMGKNFMEVPSLTKAIVVTILEDWLVKRNRSLSETQWEILHEIFDSAKLFPLYVKLMFDIVVKWTSYYTPNNDFKKCRDIDSCIEYLFKILEKSHGPKLFSRTMIYMSTFKNGISESELEDVISIDDEVLFEIFEYHVPPVRRFPSALWARIKHDLFEYMVEKEADETRVIYWYHRRFIEVANSVYVSALNELERETVFSNVIDFFNETWKDKPKPFKFNERIVKKKHLTSEVAEASRNTTSQAITFVGEDGIIRYNKRKITELPGFITLMTPNISIPLAAKHIYFNYEFLHGMFACTSVSEIFEGLKEIVGGSSYSLSSEASLALKELKFLNFFFIQCMISMSDFADSIAAQILSRALMFNGSFPFLTELLSEADQNSKNHCALIAPYQSLPPPGIGPLFVLEKHSRPINCTLFGDTNTYVFTLSTKIHAIRLTGLVNLGEIELPQLNESDQYKQMIISMDVEGNSESINNLKFMKGRAIVVSNHTMYSINIDSTLSILKIFENTKIHSIYQISPQLVLVHFDQEKYFEIYDFYSGQVVFIQNFDLKIKFIPLKNSHEINEQNRMFDDFNDNNPLIVVLENSEIKLISLNLESEVVQIEEKFTIPSPGIECIDVRRSTEVLLFSFKDGSIFLFDERKALFLIKPKEKSSKLTFKYLDLSSNLFLLLGEDQFVYSFLLDSDDDEEIISPCFVKIGDQNKYNDARFSSKEMITCVSKGVVDIYRIWCKNKVYKGVLQMSFDAHFMDITTIFEKDGLLFTSSKDSVLKAFHYGSMQMNTQYNFKLIRSKEEISYLFQINHLLFGTYSTNHSSLITIWNASNGKIEASIETEMNFIYDLEYKNKIISAVGVIEKGEIQKVYLKSYMIGIKEFHKIEYEEIKNSILNEAIQSKLLRNSNENEFVLINKTVEENNPIKIKKCFFNKNENKWKDESISNLNKCLNGIKLSTIDHTEGINYVNLSSKDKFLILLHNNELFFIEIGNNQASMSSIKARKMYKNDYFIESTNLINGKKKLFHQIEETNDFIGINKLKQIVNLSISNDLKTINEKILIENYGGFKIGLFKKNLFFESNNEIKVYNLKNHSIIFSHSFLQNKLLFACISDDCEYLATFEESKLLSIFRLSDSKRIAKIPIYNEINSILMSDHYVVMCMQDKRILSYLLVDPLKPEHSNRIRQLDSRNIEKSLTKKQRAMNNLIIAKINVILDNSSDDDAIGEEIFEDEVSDSLEKDDIAEENSDPEEIINKASNKIRKKLRKSTKILETFSLDTFKVDDVTILEPNWMIHLYKQNSFITEEEVALFTRKSELKKQLTIQSAIDLDNEFKAEQLDKNYKKELLDALIENEKDKVYFQNTKNNVSISNAYRTSSKMCLIM